ncbi:MAG: HAMP domain-containing sensor histidine kinase [Bacillota bacterium]|nr:HAMP domain-containing sensor histidine kinase [Bacillota bacterium]
MQAYIYYLVLLSFYAVSALVFISFSSIYPKKYINFIALSHILGLLTILFTIFDSMYPHNWMIRGTMGLLFLWTNFMGLAGINSFLEERIGIYIIIAAIILSLVDFFSFTFIYPVSAFIHKIFLMLLYVHLGILILKKKKRSKSIWVFGVSALFFSLVQIYFGIIFFFGIYPQIMHLDLLVYLLQSFALSFCIILVTIEESRQHFNSQVNLLQEEVCDKQREIKEAYELDKLKTEFIADISHELRTPINILFSSIQLFEVRILKEELTDDLKLYNYLNTMKQNCFRLIKLVNNLIDISRIEAGFMNFNLENWDVVGLVEGITLSVVPYAEEKEIEILFDTDFEEKVQACDADKIERIMLNLLSNAVKFTGKGGRIEVNLYNQDNNIIISVKDNGIGIPKDKQEQIYDRFIQVNDSYVRKNEGSGIGLSLVKALVELHEGVLTLESELGKGSNFRVIIPHKALKNKKTKVALDIEFNIKKVEVEFSDVYV